MLYHVDIQGYIVWYKNKPNEEVGIRNRVNGYIYTYNDEIKENRSRLRVTFQAYNETADIIEKDYPQDYNTNGQPIYSEKMQCVVSGTMIMIKAYDKSKKRYAYTPTLRIDRIYHIYRNHEEIVENLGYDKNDKLSEEYRNYEKVSEIEEEENPNFDML